MSYIDDARVVDSLTECGGCNNPVDISRSPVVHLGQFFICRHITAKYRKTPRGYLCARASHLAGFMTRHHEDDALLRMSYGTGFHVPRTFICHRLHVVHNRNSVPERRLTCGLTHASKLKAEHFLERYLESLSEGCREMNLRYCELGQT